MNSPTALAGVAVAAALLAGCAWQAPEVLLNGDETFRQRVLECPAQSSKRMPTCQVALDRLRAYGHQACSWLENRPIANEYNRYDYWNDPFDISNVAYDFAKATGESTTVPLSLERAERAAVASMAWRHICPELSERYNLPPAEPGD